ncbi:hypothetical protein KA977_14450, partial [Candidatus Dependentiae bacterium]|nr:hypothetical protein [Candidatus Dependentiae bacterium]
FFFQARDGIRFLVRSRWLGNGYKRQILFGAFNLLKNESLSSADLGVVTELSGLTELRNNDTLEWSKLESGDQIISGGLFVTYKKSKVSFKTDRNLIIKAGENTVFLLVIKDGEYICKLISGFLQIENIEKKKFTILTTLSTVFILDSVKTEIFASANLNLVNNYDNTVLIKDNGKLIDYKLLNKSSCLIMENGENKIFNSPLTIKNALELGILNSKNVSISEKKNIKIDVKFNDLDLKPSKNNSFEFKIITDKTNIVIVNNMTLKSQTGIFNAQLFLNEGKNNISIKVISPNSLETFNYDFIKIFDSTPPKLIVTRMNLDSNNKLIIEGLTEPGALVKLGNIPISVNNDGSFRTVFSNFSMFSGNISPEIKAEDEAGNINIYKSNVSELNDMSPPVIVSVQIQPASAKKNDMITVLISASDNTALSPGCSIKVKLPSGNILLKTLRLQTKNQYSGNLSGSFSNSEGIYKIEEIILNDIYNNSKIYYTNYEYLITN